MLARQTIVDGRVIAIGDIHGYCGALRMLLESIQIRREDIVITLGDYIDRGPDSRGVLDFLIELQEQATLVPILGNHDEMLLDILDGHWEAFEDWLGYGGAATLASYGCATPEGIPASHVAFLRNARSYYETDTHFFVHANYEPARSLAEQDGAALRWRSLRESLPGPHISGKTAIVGHTAQKDFEILDLGYLICIDTCCYGGGWLTALEVNTGQVWQVSASGQRREGRLQRARA